MPGQPNPPVLVEAFALNAPNSSPAAPVAGGKTVPFPAASQIAITPGAASLNDGFPPLTMTAPSAGGIPPFGEDMNGILYVLSAHIASLNAGQLYPFSATLAAAMGGYLPGARVAQAVDVLAQWINLVAGNSTNPDTAAPLGSTGWISSKPLNVVVAVGGNDIVLPGGSDYIYDVNAAGGAINITGFIPQRDGQKLTIRKVDASANVVTLQSLTGSAAGHQLQIIAGGIGLALQYMAVTPQFNATVNAWVQL
jgi:hypothetical protein